MRIFLWVHVPLHVHGYVYVLNIHLNFFVGPCACCTCIWFTLLDDHACCYCNTTSTFYALLPRLLQIHLLALDKLTTLLRQQNATIEQSLNLAFPSHQLGSVTRNSKNLGRASEQESNSSRQACVHLSACFHHHTLRETFASEEGSSYVTGTCEHDQQKCELLTLISHANRFAFHGWLHNLLGTRSDLAQHQKLQVFVLLEISVRITPLGTSYLLPAQPGLVLTCSFQYFPAWLTPVL